MNRKEMLQIELKFTREGVNSNKRFITDSIEALRMCRKILGEYYKKNDRKGYRIFKEYEKTLTSDLFRLSFSQKAKKKRIRVLQREISIIEAKEGAISVKYKDGNKYMFNCPSSGELDYYLQFERINGFLFGIISWWKEEENRIGVFVESAEAVQRCIGAGTYVIKRVIQEF